MKPKASRLLAANYLAAAAVLLCMLVLLGLTPRLCAQASLLLQYKFDEINGATTAVDSSVNGRNGTINANTDTSAAFVPGFSGNGLRFHAGTGTANWVTPPNLGTKTAFSIATWVKLDNANDWQALFHSNDWSSGKVHSALRCYTNNFQIMLPLNAAAPVDQYSDNVYPIIGDGVGVWHHVAYCYDSVAKTVKFYVDGVEKGSKTTPQQSAPTWMRSDRCPEQQRQAVQWHDG